MAGEDERTGATAPGVRMSPSHPLGRLLSILDADPTLANDKYFGLRSRLTLKFEAAGFPAPDELVDATLDRVATLLERGGERINNPVGYVLSVAKFVALERSRDRLRWTTSIDDLPERSHPAPRISAEESAQRERTFAALERCKRGLKRDDQSLIDEYYQLDKGAKIKARVQLAKRLGISMNTLSLRAFYIRRELHECLKKRLGPS